MSLKDHIPFEAQAFAEGASIHPEDLRFKLANRARQSTYFMAKAVLGFKDMTTSCHGRMAKVMHSPSKRKLVVIPRDHLKSSVCTIADSVRRITVDPNIRILLGNETATNAAHFLRRIQTVFERNEFFKWLFPELRPAEPWNSTEMLVTGRTIENPEATIEAIGVGGAVVSRHYDLLKLDDLVGKEASESDEIMRKTVDWYVYCESLLVHPTESEIHVIGTRWAFHDVISFILKHEFDQFETYWVSGLVYEGENGEPAFSHQPNTGKILGSIWPERFPPEVLMSIRKKMGTFKFSCQYDNNPRDPESSAFSPTWKKYYRWSNAELEEIGGAVKVDWRQTYRTLRYDPAISEDDRACNNAIVVDGMDKYERVWVLDVWAKHCQPFEAIQAVVDLAIKWDVQAIGIESVLFQRVLKYPINAELERRGTYIQIIELKTDNKKSKKSRIRGVQPYFERGQIFMCESGHEQLDQEYDDFPTGSLVDCLDAFAYGPQMWMPWNGDDVDPDEFTRIMRAEMQGMNPVTGY